jgi:predicted aspartyl protease
MKYPFEKPGPLIIVTMKLEHGDKSIDVEVALDTGAATTLINASIAEYLGCKPETSNTRKQIITASGIEWCPIIYVDKITTCGKSLHNVDVICHDLPPATIIRGLLGENFLKHFDLHINYHNRFVELK